MAYDRRKIISFGVGGVAIAAILILAFLPVRVEVGINPTVALQEIPGYGFQIVKISEEQASMVHLNVTLDGFEVLRQDGVWTELTVESVSFNMLRNREISFNAQAGSLDAGNYTGIRFRVVRGFEFTNATLDTEEVVSVDVPNFKVELTSIFEIGVETEGLYLKLRTGSGLLSNYMLPKIHLSIETMKIEVVVNTSARDIGKEPAINFEQLFANPNKYDDTNIVIEGFYFHGWEVIVICEELGYSGFAEGHLTPMGRMIWVEGGIPKDVFEVLHKQEIMGPEERFGKIRVLGKFEFGGKFGHLGSYNSQIILSEVELLQWST